MAENSSSSISDRFGRDKEIIGIPKSCGCGIGVSLRVSNSVKNPNRCYFRCDLAYERKLQNDTHVFKWLDKAMVEEAGIMSRKFDDISVKIDDLQKDTRDLFLLVEDSEQKFQEGLMEMKKISKTLKMMMFFVVVGTFGFLGLSNIV